MTELVNLNQSDLFASKQYGNYEQLVLVLKYIHITNVTSCKSFSGNESNRFELNFLLQPASICDNYLL
jgi:hypothetical protein